MGENRKVVYIWTLYIRSKDYIHLNLKLLFHVESSLQTNVVHY